MDIALLDQRVCSGRYLDLMTGPFHGTVGSKIKYDSRQTGLQWPLVCMCEQDPTALGSGFGPCAQNAVGALGMRCHWNKVGTVQWK